MLMAVALPLARLVWYTWYSEEMSELCVDSAGSPITNATHYADKASCETGGGRSWSHRKYARIVLLSKAGWIFFAAGLFVYWTQLKRQTPAFEFLLDKMRGGWAWWQMVILARKMAVMGFALLFNSRPVLGWFLSMLVIMVALVAQGMASPYTSGELNTIEFCSLLFTLLIMTSGMAFRAENLEALQLLQDEQILDSRALNDATFGINSGTTASSEGTDPVQSRQMEIGKTMVSHYLQDACLVLVAVMGVISFFSAGEAAWGYASPDHQGASRLVMVYTLTCTCAGFLIGRMADPRGFRDSVSIDCFAATKYHNYTQAQQDRLLEHCPVACGVCTPTCNETAVGLCNETAACQDDEAYLDRDLGCADWQYDLRAICAFAGLTVGIMLTTFSHVGGRLLCCFKTPRAEKERSQSEKQWMFRGRLRPWSRPFLLRKGSGKLNF